MSLSFNPSNKSELRIYCTEGFMKNVDMNSCDGIIDIRSEGKLIQIGGTQKASCGGTIRNCSKQLSQIGVQQEASQNGSIVNKETVEIQKKFRFSAEIDLFLSIAVKAIVLIERFRKLVITH